MAETKTYWCVTSKYDDEGNVTSCITDKIRSDKKPKNGFESEDQFDIYNDWFESIEDAEAFVRSQNES